MANVDLQRYLDELRAHVSIVDVVGAKVKLVKKGREYQGLCPFHNEKTPSFTVNESKGFYHCFGCSAHGDIVKFEMEANGLPFMDAIQKLSHQAGLQMPKFTQKDKEENESKKTLYEIMETACTFFEKELRMPEGSEGYKYFTEKRGLTTEIIKKFRLGFAPNNNALMALLKSQGIDEKDMKELGLIAIPEDTSRRPHDFFRNRVMIPITNKQGKIIAFGGRVMEKIEPKYLNSPETPIFNKRRNLYNLDKAREVAYKEKNLIICEGYMDVIALDSYGFGYAVAPLGTALTEEQIDEAWKVCPEPILCLDGDAPGVKAAMRAVDRVLPILKAGYSLKFLFLPDNQDPDEYLKAKGHDSFAALMTKTSPLIDILWRKYTENEDSSTPEKKALIEKTLLGEVAKITDPTVRSYYAQEIKNRIFHTFKRNSWQTPKPVEPRPTPTQPKISEPIINEAKLEHQIVQHTIAQHPNNNYNNRPRPQQWQKNNNQRPLLNHAFSASISTLHPNINIKQDKNARFIIASMLIFPELMEEYEEQFFTDKIVNKDIVALYDNMQNIYQNKEEPMSAEELFEALSKTSSAQTLKDLWEYDMLKNQSPFIRTMRNNIDKILLEDKLRILEEDIKTLSAELGQNFTEEKYQRLTALKEERNKILAPEKDEK